MKTNTINLDEAKLTSIVKEAVNNVLQEHEHKEFFEISDKVKELLSNPNSGIKYIKEFRPGRFLVEYNGTKSEISVEVKWGW